MDNTNSNIIIQAIAAGSFAKVLVDGVKISAIPSPSWILPILAFAFGIICAFLLSVASGQELVKALIATDILVGILAGGSAIGITELQKKADN